MTCRADSTCGAGVTASSLRTAAMAMMFSAAGRGMILMWCDGGGGHDAHEGGAGAWGMAEGLA